MTRKLVKENLKHLISWVIRDVIKEETDTMNANGITTAELGKYGAPVVAQWYLKHLN